MSGAEIFGDGRGGAGAAKQQLRRQKGSCHPRRRGNGDEARFAAWSEGVEWGGW